MFMIYSQMNTKKEQRELLDQLGKYDREGSCHPMGKSFFDRFKDLFQ